MNLLRIAHWLGPVLLAAGLLVGGSGSAIAQNPPATLAAPTTTLYDQTDFPGSNTADSTNWGNQFRTLNSQAADDFVVPGNVIWHITSASASGAYIGSAPSGNLSLLVQFYINSSGLPLSRIFSQTVATGNISGLDTGIFVFPVSPALALGPGHYWFTVQDSVTCTATNCKHWGWTERTLQSPLPQLASVWENPAGGSGSPPACMTWQPRVDVCHVPDNSTGKDLLFKLAGTSAPVVANLMLPLVRR